MNWGKGIALSLVLFMGFIIILAVRMMSQKLDLVSSNYYEQGVEYEQQQIAASNYGALAEGITVNPNAEQAMLEITYPVSLRTASGYIVLYRPSDRAMDRSYEVAYDTNGIQLISTHDLASGRWELQFTLKAESQDYQHQTNLYLP